jgi:hypothetical protein
MRRPNRSPRVAALCLQGSPVRDGEQNDDRARLVTAVAKMLHEHPELHPLDALVFPGGFFWIEGHLSRSSLERRRRHLEQQAVVLAITDTLWALEHLSPGLQLVCGARLATDSSEGRLDDVSFGFGHDGLRAETRWLRPRGRHQRCLIDDEYRLTDRFLPLPNGSVALLSPAYDLLEVSAGPAANKAQGDALADWARLVADRAPDVALITADRLETTRSAPRSLLGLETASALLDGALAVAGGYVGEAGTARYVQATAGVPRVQLSAAKAGRDRRILLPVRSIPVMAAGLVAELRLYRLPTASPTGR